jgi:hypothetical protein
MDIGAGGYDLLKVGYDENNQKISVKDVISFSTPQLMLSLNYAHHSPSTGYGCSARLFDNRINSMLWMKILQNVLGEVRVECEFITPPFGRHQRPWESYGGNIVQLRYRTGF